MSKYAKWFSGKCDRETRSYIHIRLILREPEYHVERNKVLSFCSQAIYDMLGACSSNRPADSAEERAKNIFAKMDENNDGQLTQDEFLKGCLQDEELSKMLAP